MRFSPATVLQRAASPLGEVWLAASPLGLCGLWFVTEQRHLPPALAAERAGHAAWPTDTQHPLLCAAVAQLQQYFAGTRRAFDLPLDLSSGTAFQQRVWHALAAIGHGRTCSYGDLARQIGAPQAVRAVGAAVGRNPISIVLPCHRVLGAQGALTGYAGALWRKEALLQHEGVLPSRVLQELPA